MRKILKNKFVMLVITVIVLSILYFSIEKVIEQYNNVSNNIITQQDFEKTYEEDEGNMQYEKEDLNLITEEIEADKVEENNESEENADNKIYVHVTGEVNNSGVVTLNAGARIVDAINAAGGTTSKADLSKINLVYKVEDGMKINVPNAEDLKEDSSFEYITKNSGDKANEENLKLASSEEDTSTLDKTQNVDIVNINTASQTELETLPGIGPSIALKIINYRKENGKFEAIEEIKNVTGIGDNKYETLKKYITI